jgi:uncharacterized protein YjiS (DUF1127 family)
MFRRLVWLPLSLLLWPVRVAESRRVMAALGALDDRGLADIGLSRQDLRDVTALPLAVDPTPVLAGRAAERQALARRARRKSSPPPPRLAAE